MTKQLSRLHSLTAKELADLFVESAVARTIAIDKMDPRTGNKYFDTMTNIYSELKSRGIESQRALLPLLHHEDPGVRLNAAALAFEFAPELAEPVIDSLAKLDGFVGFEAELVLEIWQKGELEFPPYARAKGDK